VSSVQLAYPLIKKQLTPSGIIILRNSAPYTDEILSAQTETQTEPTHSLQLDDAFLSSFSEIFHCASSIISFGPVVLVPSIACSSDAIPS
jgi:hypothetical protein